MQEARQGAPGVFYAAEAATDPQLSMTYTTTDELTAAAGAAGVAETVASTIAGLGAG